MSTLPDTYQLPVVFTTQTPYPLPAQKFLIPASWRRYHLSQLVNKALELTSPIPFDFLVQGELLRGTLGEWCAERGVSGEETLEVEYIQSVLPPQRSSQIPHDDWVSAVSCQMLPNHLLTASYDGHLRVFDASQTLAHTISAHSAPITSACIFQPTTRVNIGTDVDEQIIASASQDHTAQLTSLSISASSSGPSSYSISSKALATLHLHTSPISSISVSHDASHLLTAGWDKLIGVWDTTIPSTDQLPEADELEDDDGSSRKKRKRTVANGSNSEGRDGTSVGAKRKAPITVLKSHTDRVTRALFARGENKRAFSCSLDSTVRTWDVEVGVTVGTVTAPDKPFLDICTLYASTSSPNTPLLAACAADRSITLYDTRHTSLSLPSAASSGNTNPSASVGIIAPSSSADSTPGANLSMGMQSCLAASPNDPFRFASGGYDGIVRVWDVRSLKAEVSSLRMQPPKAPVTPDGSETHDAKKKAGNKVLAIDWSEGGVLAAGGEAGVEIWKMG